MRVAKVDLDALEMAAGVWRTFWNAGEAANCEAAIAELRELRELVGLLEFADTQLPPNFEWYLQRTDYGTYIPHQIRRCFWTNDKRYATLREALAAARKWEAENA